MTPAPVETAVSPNSARVTRASKNANMDKEDLTLEQKMNRKFSKLEAAMESMAASVAVLASKRDKSKRKRDTSDDPPPTHQKKKAKKAKKAKKGTKPTEETVTTAQTEDTRVAPISDKADSLMPAFLNVDLTSSATPAPTSGHDLAPAPKQHGGASKQDDWSAWVLAISDLLPPVGLQPASIKDFPNDSQLQAQVKSIIESSANSLSKGTSKVGEFPFTYVKRGDEKKRATINSCSLPEHIWGIFAMIKDPGVKNDIKPALLQHMEEVVEDCREYEWPAVRRWSEEVFSLVAEGRLLGGWHATSKIQMLRITLSKVITAKLSTLKDYGGKFKVPNTSHQNDNWKPSGPPCFAFNQREGCSLPNGHINNGKRLQHICSYCFFTAASTFYHSEQNCRNKARDNANNQHHFQ